MTTHYNIQWLPGQPLPEVFFSLTAKLYQQQVWRIPENRKSIEQQFSSKNPYFHTGKAQVFIAEAQARLVGFYQDEQRIDNEKVAYFGFWETDCDLSLNRDLFAELALWAKAQGAQRLYGPINFTTYGDNRLRIDSFEQANFIGEPGNFAYYPELLHQLGFNIKYHYASYIQQDVQLLARQMAKPLTQAKEQHQHLLFSRLDRDIWLQHLPELYPLVDMIFKENFAYSAISFDSFSRLCGESFARKLCPKSSVLVKDEQGDIAGFFLVFPDYAELVNQSGQQLASTALDYHLHYQLLQQPRLALAKTGGVHPKYRSTGLFTLMSMQLTIWAADYYEQIAGAMVREDNHSISYASNGSIRRNYALFEKAL